MNEKERSEKIVLDGEHTSLKSLANMQGFEVERVIPNQGVEMRIEDKPYF